MTHLGPYELDRVHLGDCIELMKALPDKSVVTVTDAPYGVGVDYGVYDDTREELQRLINYSMPEILRVSRVALIFTGVKNLSLYPLPTWTLCWYTPAGTSSSSWGFSCWQPVVAYGKDPHHSNKGRGRDVIAIQENKRKYVTRSNQKNKSKNKSIHPCPKPERVMRHFIERASITKDDVIFDPFSGSGTTGVAAIQTGRRFLGFEIDPRWCDLANKRIEAAKAQTVLQLEGK